MISKRLTVATATACAIVAGCGFGPKEDPSQFYVLSAVADSVPTSVVGKRFIGVGPIGIPVYLERPQIVSRYSDNKLVFSEWSRWAEPLEEAIIRVLSENLTRSLGTETVIGFPWYTPSVIETSVAVEFERFEADSAGVAHLHTRWIVREGAAGDILLSGETVLSETPVSEGGRERVAALSRLLARLSDELADAIVSAQ